MLVLLDIDISFTLVFEGNPLRYEKGLYLPSIKHDALFHVNMKTFGIFMKQSQFHGNGVSPLKEWLCKESTSSFLQAIKPNKKISL
jgi:hypothetical protein